MNFLSRHNKYYPYILIVIIIAAFLRNILLPSTNQILSAGDIKHIYYPYREFLRSHISSGQIPFWNPYLFSGTPFLAHPYSQIYYPTTLSLLFLPTNIYFPLVIFLHVVIAAISMYMLMKKFTGILASLASASVFALGGYFASRIYAGHLDYIISSSLIPLIVLKGYEYINEDNKKSLLIGSVTIALQIFTGLLIMTIYIFAILFFISLFTTKNIKANIRTFYKKFLLICLSGILLSAAYLIPSYQFISQTIRGEGLTYNLASYGSSSWKSLFMFVNPSFLGSDFSSKNPYHGPPPDYAGFVYFIGFLPLIIISIGLTILIFHLLLQLLNSNFIPIKSGQISNLQNFSFIFVDSKRFNYRLTIALIVITVLSVLVSLGPNSPINLHYLLWNLVSIYKTTRLPVRHLIIASFALSMLFGLCLSTVKIRTIKIIIIALTVFELFSFSSPFLKLDSLPSLIPDDLVFKDIIGEKEIMRILPDFTLNSPVREQISFASPLTYKYFSTSGYTPAILTTYYDFIDAINGNRIRSTDLFSSEILPTMPYLEGISYLNAKYIIVDNSADLLFNLPKDYHIISETSLYRIYENQNVIPRFFFVPEAIVYNSINELKNNLYADQKNFRNKIVIPSTEVFKIKHQQNCSKNISANISIEKYQLNSVFISLNTPCNGFLSSSEVNFSGWEAKIDGKQIPIIRSNLSFKALNIPAGRHRIEFYYNPKIWIFSLLISFLCFATLVIYTKKDTH